MLSSVTVFADTAVILQSKMFGSAYDFFSVTSLVSSVMTKDSLVVGIGTETFERERERRYSIFAAHKMSK